MSTKDNQAAKETNDRRERKEIIYRKIVKASKNKRQQLFPIRQRNKASQTNKHPRQHRRKLPKSSTHES